MRECVRECVVWGPGEPSLPRGASRTEQACQRHQRGRRGAEDSVGKHRMRLSDEHTYQYEDTYIAGCGHISQYEDAYIAV